MTQKSEQRNPAEKFFSENKLIGVLETLVYEFNDQQRDIIFDFAVLYASHAIGSLAEEAEKEVLTKVQYSDCRMYWRSFAAWLREKAR